MKHLILLCLSLPVLLFCGPAARAQNIPPQYADTLAKLKAAAPEQRAAMQTNLMQSKLQLNDAQLKQVAAINLSYARKIEPILRSDDSRFSKYRKIKPMLDEKDEKLKGVFTVDQFKKYQDIKKELMDQARKAMNS